MSWTLRCLNKACKRTFVAGSAASRCPKCKGRRTRWIPSGIAIQSKSPSVDRVARGLAAEYEMGNMPTPERGNSARRPVTPPEKVNVQVAPGWNMDVPIGKDKHGLPTPMAACAPANVTAKFRPADGSIGRVTLSGPKPRLAAPPYRVNS